MPIQIKPSEICIRIAKRYYPMVAIIGIPTSYIINRMYSPGLDIVSLIVLGNIGSLYFWLIVIFALYFVKPVGAFYKLLVMAVTYSIGFLIPYIGSALYFDFNPSPFSGDPLISRIIILTLMFGFFIIGVVILVERSLITEKAYLEEKTGSELSEKQLIEKQLSLLQAMVEPHFLFATMDRISELFDNSPEKSKTMLISFIQYLRATLVKAREPVTTIGQEMELIRSYLDIFKNSLGERLLYQIEIDPHAKHLPFPSMLIQPIVENAIKHSLEKDPEGGGISISVTKKDNGIRVEIAATGNGLDIEDREPTIFSDVKERIRFLFGNKGGFRLEENQPSGLIAIIEIPCG